MWEFVSTSQVTQRHSKIFEQILQIQRNRSSTEMEVISFIETFLLKFLFNGDQQIIKQCLYHQLQKKKNILFKSTKK